MQRQQQDTGKHVHILEQSVQPRHAMQHAVHGPWTHLMIASKQSLKTNKQTKNWVLLKGLGEQVGFQL